jgi:mannose-6-phosphate isomerase-like protein (cupin superfamily)
MMYDVRIGIVATLAFAAGVAVARLQSPAHAAAPALQPQTIDFAAMTADSFPPPSPALPKLLSKTVVVADGMTAAIQTGFAPKHFHANADEIQIILEGTGTEWLGDHQVNLKPGTMVVIPKGAAHAAFAETSGHLKWVSMKTPPQDPADVHPL